MDRRGEGVLHGRGPRLRVSRADPLDRWAAPRHGRPEDRRLSVVGAGPQRRCQLRLPLDRQCRGLFRPRPALCRPLFSGAGRGLRRGRFAGPRPGRPRRCTDFGRLAIGQPLLDDPGARTLSAGRQDQPVVPGRHVVPPHGIADRSPSPSRGIVQRPLLLRRAARFPQNHRYHLHDRR